MRPVVLLGLVACLPDDWNGEPYLGPPSSSSSSEPTDTGTGIPVDDPRPLGTWVSEGDDRSPLFADPPFSYDRVETTFRDDGAYDTSTEGPDGVVTLSGTVRFDDSTTPGTVTVDQVSPYVATASGLWQRDGDVLTWEVVQVLPDYGFLPPTPESGFGTTSGPGLVPDANVQIYRRGP